jgi:hypothetical protein
MNVRLAIAWRIRGLLGDQRPTGINRDWFLSAFWVLVIGIAFWFFSKRRK